MDISELRKLARARHRAATAKISRNRKKGIELLQTEFDPRQSLEKVDKMTKRQLAQYVARLNRFTSRKKQFVGLGEDKRPTTKASWKRLQQAERRYNRVRKEYFDALKDVNIGGMTGEQRMEMFQTINPQMHKAAENMNFRPRSYDPSQITGPEQMEKLRLSLLRQSTPEYIAQRAAAGRIAATNMLGTIGNDRIAKRIEGLSAKQWEMLWMIPGAARELSAWYENAKYLGDESRGTERSRAAIASMGPDSESLIDSFIDSVMDKDM